VSLDGWRGEGALLVGSSGFFGSAILRLFPGMLSAGRTQPAVPCRHVPLRTLQDLSPLRDEVFDRVILCTGTSRHVELADQPADIAMQYHLQPTIDVGEQLRHRNLKSFVRLSTVLLFDETRGTLPIDEQSPVNPYRDRYVLSQYLGEEAGHFYGATTLRICNTYGPSARPRTDIIHRLISELRENGRAGITSRAPERDFVFVDDAARALAALSRSEAKGLFVLGSGVSTTVGAVADHLAEIARGAVTSQDLPPAGIPAIRVNSAKLQAATGWRPTTSLREGLETTWRAMNAPGH